MLTRAAGKCKGDGVLDVTSAKLDDDPPAPEAWLCAMTLHSDSAGGYHCEVCNRVNGELQCWMCGKYYHHQCVSNNYPTRRGPWHC